MSSFPDSLISQPGQKTMTVQKKAAAKPTSASKPDKPEPDQTEKDKPEQDKTNGSGPEPDDQENDQDQPDQEAASAASAEVDYLNPHTGAKAEQIAPGIHNLTVDLVRSDQIPDQPEAVPAEVQLEAKTREANGLAVRVGELESENAELRQQMAAKEAGTITVN
jgi:hypothetical protein